MTVPYWPGETPPGVAAVLCGNLSGHGKIGKYGATQSIAAGHQSSTGKPSPEEASAFLCGRQWKTKSIFGQKRIVGFAPSCSNLTASQKRNQLNSRQASSICWSETYVQRDLLYPLSKRFSSCSQGSCRKLYTASPVLLGAVSPKLPQKRTYPLSLEIPFTHTGRGLTGD